MADNPRQCPKCSSAQVKIFHFRHAHVHTIIVCLNCATVGEWFEPEITDEPANEYVHDDGQFGMGA